MDLFTEITLLILSATVVATILRVLRQPIIVSYILTGLLVGPGMLGLVQSGELIESFSVFGISLLLFIVGLNLSPLVIREVGKVSLIAGVLQMSITTAGGFILSILFGFSYIESLYIGIALAFSSTIIILKILTDKGELAKLHAKIIVGTLLVQDLFAAIILVIIGSFADKDTFANGAMSVLGLLILKGALIAALLYFASKYVLPKVFDFFASSQEFLFLIALSWAMGLALLFKTLGFSIEIGALVAGISISVLPYNLEIASKLKPLRDFFLILFFVSLGIKFSFDELAPLAMQIAFFSIFVIVGNPIIMFFIMGKRGFSKRTTFLSGLSMAQVSEFSLIMIALGVKVGHIGSQISLVVTAVAFITIAVSSYLIAYSDYLYPYARKYMHFFVKKSEEAKSVSIAVPEIILFGANRIGYSFLDAFKKMDKKFIVVDYDPDIISIVAETGGEIKYGDAEDSEFLDELNLDRARMIISTIPDFDANKMIINKVKSINHKVIILAVSHSIKEAFQLYEMGVDYVIMPHFLGGEFASKLVEENQFDENKFTAYRDDHIQKLHMRKKLGHEHPNGRRK